MQKDDNSKGLTEKNDTDHYYFSTIIFFISVIIFPSALKELGGLCILLLCD
jgi:hypothetical protein